MSPFPSIRVLGLKIQSAGCCDRHFTAVSSLWLLISIFLMLIYNSCIATFQLLFKCCYLFSVMRNNSLIATTVQFFLGMSPVRFPKCTQVLHSVSFIGLKALKME